MAGDDRDHHEQQKIEDLVRPGEIEAVVGREEEIARPQDAGDRRDQGRDQAEMPAGQQHRQQINDRAAAHVEVIGQCVDHECGGGDHHQRDRAAPQLAANGIGDHRSSLLRPRRTQA